MALHIDDDDVIHSSVPATSLNFGKPTPTSVHHNFREVMVMHHVKAFTTWLCPAHSAQSAVVLPPLLDIWQEPWKTKSPVT